MSQWERMSEVCMNWRYLREGYKREGYRNKRREGIPYPTPTTGRENMSLPLSILKAGTSVIPRDTFLLQRRSAAHSVWHPLRLPSIR